MGTNKPYVKAWIKPDELKLTDELCRRKGYRRSTFIREIVKFCAFNNLSPDEMRELLEDYNNLRRQVKNKAASNGSKIEWWQS